MAEHAYMSEAKQEWLDFAAKAPPPLEGSLEFLRTSMARTKAAMNEKTPMPRESLKVEDLSVPVRDGAQIAVRFYKPRGAVGLPVVVIFHGGGFALGNLDNEEVSSRVIADSCHAAVFNVDYRLAPEHPFPVGLHDSYDVVKWIATNYESLKINPKRGFVVGGFSGGSNFAAVISQLARDERMDPPITGQLLSCPSVVNRNHVPEEYKDELQSVEQNANAPVINIKSLEIFEGHYQVGDWTDPMASPLLHPNLSGLPKAYFQVTGLDPLRDEGLLYEKVLRRNSVQTKLDIYPGLPHIFWNFPGLPSSIKWKQDLTQGVEWLLEA
ncbi:Alpha/Beta hydrolase protein [Ilyonectria destructans]|nr:Alpha/Beta hydrolase protein [Ilyonectria destructans]